MSIVYFISFFSGDNVELIPLIKSLLKAQKCDYNRCKSVFHIVFHDCGKFVFILPFCRQYNAIMAARQTIFWRQLLKNCGKWGKLSFAFP